MIHIPANDKDEEIKDNYKVDSYLVKEIYGLIWLWYSQDKKNVPEIPFFEDQKEGLHMEAF